MPLFRHHPAAPLDRYVECFWWSQRELPQDYCEHMLPSGSTQLVLALHEAPMVCAPGASSGSPITWTGSLLHGPQWRYYLAGPKPPGAVAGVAFRPGAAGAVLGTGMTDLADEHLGLGALWGRRGELLHEQLMAAAGPAAVFRILEQVLGERVQPAFVMHPAVAHALSRRAPAWVAQVQREAGYSPRHFIALFREAVGMTPKHYFRIRRFNEVLRRLAAGPEAGLAGIAAATGYADQAHLTREFRELAGVTPRQYRPRGADSPLHHRAPQLLESAIRR